MTFSPFLYAISVTLLTICTVAAQQPNTQSNGLLQAIGMKPDTVAPLSRSDSMRLIGQPSGSSGLAVPAANAPATGNGLNGTQPDEDFVPDTYYSAETDDANAPKTGKLSGRLTVCPGWQVEGRSLCQYRTVSVKDSSSAGGGLTDETGCFFHTQSGTRPVLRPDSEHRVRAKNPAPHRHHPEQTHPRPGYRHP